MTIRHLYTEKWLCVQKHLSANYSRNSYKVRGRGCRPLSPLGSVAGSRYFTDFRDAFLIRFLLQCETVLSNRTLPPSHPRTSVPKCVLVKNELCNSWGLIFFLASEFPKTAILTMTPPPFYMLFPVYEPDPRPVEMVQVAKVRNSWGFPALFQ